MAFASNELSDLEFQKFRGSGTNVSVGVSLSSSPSGSFTDRSGSITSANTSQQVAPANPSRVFLFIENVSTADLWFNFGTAAVASQPSVKIVANGTLALNLPGFINQDSVNVIGGTVGQQFTVKEA